MNFAELLLRTSDEDELVRALPADGEMDDQIDFPASLLTKDRLMDEIIARKISINIVWDRVPELTREQLRRIPLVDMDPDLYPTIKFICGHVRKVPKYSGPYDGTIIKLLPTAILIEYLRRIGPDFIPMLTGFGFVDEDPRLLAAIIAEFPLVPILSSVIKARPHCIEFSKAVAEELSGLLGEDETAADKLALALEYCRGRIGLAYEQLDSIIIRVPQLAKDWLFFCALAIPRR